MRSVLICLALSLTTVLHAGPAELAIIAAMKLPDAPNYSWVTSVEDDARSYEISGKTDKSDYSLVDMPMVSAVRRRAVRGSSNSDNQVEAIFKGEEKLVIQTPDGWRTPAELARAAPTRGGGFPGGPGGPGGFGGGGPGARRGRRGPGGPDGATPPYSNLQLSLSRPHDEIGIIVANHSSIATDGDSFSGTLTETGAKLLLVHSGQKEVTPLQAAGTFRFWVQGGTLVKYEVRLEGTLAVMTNGTRREVAVHQTATTQLKNVGTTTVEVPDEAKKKLGT